MLRSQRVPYRDAEPDEDDVRSVCKRGHQAEHLVSHAATVFRRQHGPGVRRVAPPPRARDSHVT